MQENSFPRPQSRRPPDIAPTSTRPPGEAIRSRSAHIILSPEAEDYDAFVSVWGEVGTKEDDGYYIFRAVDKLGDNVTFIHLTK